MLRPLLLFSLIAPSLVIPASAESPKTVRFLTPDDVAIMATFYPSMNRTSPAAILVHGLGQDRANWSAFIPPLRSNGIAVLAIDLRGHGQSRRRITADGVQNVAVEDFTPRDYQDFLLDLNAAVDWLSAQPSINPRRLAVVGADMGANIAARYAEINDDLAALVLLSPTINNQGVRTDDVIGNITTTPLRIVASQFDAFTFESCRHLAAVRQAALPRGDPREFITCTGYLHGTEMLARVKGLPDLLVPWLCEQLGVRPPKAAPSR
jgi:alpha-beta hydrolase superfamily lysophospholipase